MNKAHRYRTVIFFKDYFQIFFDQQSKKVKAKIIWTLDLLHTDGLYEVRVLASGNIFRIFCFFDKGQLVVVANGFQKKTQKTPKNEIEMALRIKAEYEKEKR